MAAKDEVTDKDVEKSRTRVEKLRDQLAQVNADVVESEASRNNRVRQASLDAEADRLEVELAAARERLKASKKSDDTILDNLDDAVQPEVDTTPDPDLEPTPTPAPGDKTKER